MSILNPSVNSGPALVVDFGTTTSSAALVLDGEVVLVEEPATQSPSWPSAVCVDGDSVLVGTPARNLGRIEPLAYRAEFKRLLGEAAPITLGSKSFRPVELVTELLVAMRAQALTVLGDGGPARAVLTVPAAYAAGDPRPDLMIDAAERAGFSEVELLSEPVAAAHAPVSGPPLPAGAVIMVYDFGGGTFDTALVRVAADGQHEVLGHAALDGCGGRDVDAVLMRTLREMGGEPLAALLSPGGDADDRTTAMHTGLELAELATRVKHQLTDAPSAREYFRPTRQRMDLDRATFAGLAGPIVSETVRCCQELIVGTGIPMSTVECVVMVGGSSRMPLVGEALTAAFDRPLRHARNLATAVVLGAAEWSRGAATRELPPRPDGDHHPVRWDLPGGVANLVRWLVSPGEPVAPGSPVALVRLPSGALWRLLGDAPAGTLAAFHADPGDAITRDDWLATIAVPSPNRHLTLTHDDDVWAVSFASQDRAVAVVTDSSGLCFWSRATGERDSVWNGLSGSPPLAFSPDGQRLAISAGSHSVDIWDLTTGSMLSDISTGGSPSAVAISPSGQLLATGLNDGVHIWEIATGRQLRQRDLGSARLLAFSLDGRRLVCVGRLSVQVWDMVERKLLPGRSLAPGAVAISPNGRLLAEGVGSGTVLMSDLELDVRTDVAVDGDALVVALAFSPDGRRIAVGCEDGSAHVLEHASGRVLLSLEHFGAVRGVVFSSDGRAVATAGADRVVLVAELPD